MSILPVVPSKKRSDLPLQERVRHHAFATKNIIILPLTIARNILHHSFATACQLFFASTSFQIHRIIRFMEGALYPRVFLFGIVLRKYGSLCSTRVMFNTGEEGLLISLILHAGHNYSV